MKAPIMTVHRPERKNLALWHQGHSAALNSIKVFPRKPKAEDEASARLAKRASCHRADQFGGCAVGHLPPLLAKPVGMGLRAWKSDVCQRGLTFMSAEGGCAMKKFLGTITAILVGWSPLAAFEHVEADAAYNGTIKQQIMSEFSQGTKMLKARVDVTMREKDINVLQQHMYNKAILMGRCVDKAATVKKNGSGKISLEKHSGECIQEHLKFIAKEPALPFRCTDMKFWEPPYAFLMFESMSSATDYLAIKECYDRLAARDRLGHELGLGWERLRTFSLDLR
jgi:hypothetical protein